MAFYYPQDVTEEMGPTGVVPGSHYYNQLPDPDAEVSLFGEAGTVTLVHYDLWHRATPNRSEKRRYMVKFLFTRLEEPERPSWDSTGGMWTGGDDSHGQMWKSVWDWYCGAHPPPVDRTAGDGDVSELIRALRSESESACLRAAYALGAMGAPAVPALIDVLRDESESVRRNAGYALCAMGASAVPSLIEAVNDPREWTRASAVEILGDTGRPAQDAVPVLIKALHDTADAVRRQAAEALGTVGEAAQAAVPALAGALRDHDEWVRRNAALALVRLGRLAEEAVPALIEALRDENRYVRAKAAKALERIGTPAAQGALFRFFTTSMWCPLTTKERPY
jgi:hypothetical protein